MKFTQKEPPRSFRVGQDGRITLNDCGKVELGSDEQVTFTTESGTEYDVVKKSWGYYATPSLNQRLLKFGLHAALIKSPDGKYYIFLVENERKPLFDAYIKNENLKIICWLDNDKVLEKLESLEGVKTV
ncbi:hypothetical protein BVX98_04310 [bacterium F11]|nr:hypothetical protein BVX98_04310 [bacterium F11]